MMNSLPQVRRTWIAAALSMSCCGLGQVYCGQLSRGLVMYGISLLFVPAVMLSMQGTSTLWLWMFLGSVVAVTVVYVGSIWDAQRLASRSTSQPSGLMKTRRSLVSWLMVLTSVPYTLCLGFSLRADVVEAFYLPSSSMEPTLMKGDRFLVDKTGVTTRVFEHGDLIVFRVPDNPQQRWVKRIVGLPGDTVEMRHGELLINGAALKREAITDVAQAEGQEQARPVYETNGERRYQVLIGQIDENADFPATTVPDDGFFVLGDHRGQSHDSRQFGLVSRANIVGVVKWIYSPAGSWERFGSVQ
ncbi:MAG: signal peptidase I [Planctomycetaceae bacterium]|nr:signal peptidase I [Planctomycetaceae bacterium]